MDLQSPYGAKDGADACVIFFFFSRQCMPDGPSFPAALVKLLKLAGDGHIYI